MNRQVLEQALECFADPARRQQYFDVYAEDAVLTGHAGVAPGLANIRRYYEEFWAAFPDAQIQLDELIENGDDIALRYTVTATHQGPFLGIPASGRRIEIPSITTIRFRDGKCVQRWNTSSAHLLHEQISGL